MIAPPARPGCNPGAIPVQSQGVTRASRVPHEVEALVRAHLPRLRAGLCAEVPPALGEPLALDYPARVERGLIDPARELAAAVWALAERIELEGRPGRPVRALADESHDVEAP